MSRHEAAAAYTAAAYAKSTGKLGVVISCSGPGSTNLITGVASAMRERIPLLVLTGQTISTRHGLGPAQETSPWFMDVCRAFEPFTKKSVWVSQAQLLPQNVRFASRIALQQPQGPVHLAIPIDVQNTPIPRQIVADMALARPFTITSSPSESGVQQLVAFIRRGRGVVVIGAGAKRALIPSKIVVEFMDAVGWPVVTSASGKGLIPETHHLSAGDLSLRCLWFLSHNNWFFFLLFPTPKTKTGIIGLSGHARAEAAIKNAQRLLVLGSGLGETASGADWSVDFFSRVEIAQIDACPENIGRTFHPKIAIVCDIANLIPPLLQALGPNPNDTRVATASLPPFEKPDSTVGKHIETLASLIPKNALVYSDIGEVCLSAAFFVFLCGAPPTTFREKKPLFV